jgi:hypothetical protein
VFWISLWLLSETFLILRWIHWDTIKQCIVVFMSSTCSSCPILMKILIFSSVLKNTQT